MEIRQATLADADAVQRLRKHAWRARYLHPETGVTTEVLQDELAVLPPTHDDLSRYGAMLSDPRNEGRNLVAVVDQRVVGTVTYGRGEDGTGNIGVFVAEGFDGTGVGDALLQALIRATDEPLEVAIFARNPSREFYRRHGFEESGSEFVHWFREGVGLPVQVLRLSRRLKSFSDVPVQIASRTAAGERIALILLDALGLELLMRERDHPLVKRLHVVSLDSQFPSTTAAHVTTMHLAEPVEQHGLYEWRVLEPTLGEVIVPLRFRLDASDIDGDLEGRLDPRALISSPTMYQKLTTRSVVVEPVRVAASAYDRAATAGAQSITFEDLDDGLERLVERMRGETEVGYAYVYWPMIDTVGHHYGPSSTEFRAAARRALDTVAAHVDAFIRLGVTVLLTADHGQIDVHPDRVDYLDEIWPELSRHLTQRAAGSCRDVFLHVAPGKVDHVISNLADRLDGRADVCRATDLFPKAGPRLSARLADVAVLPVNGREAWLRATPSVEGWNLGQHGGRAGDETATYLAQVQT